MALPWLDAMWPVRRRLAPPPVRCAFVFAPNGMKMDEWTPSTTGRGFELPATLAALAPHRDAVLVLSGLALDGGRAHGDGPGDHARAAASYLTCAHPRKTGGADLHNGVSVDQVLAAEVGAATRFPSLELGMERGRSAGVCDSGYSCAYSNNVSWRTPTTPVAKETDPRAVFARLFGDPDRLVGAERQAIDERRKRSVLDAVLEDARALRRELGRGDRAKLDEYLTAVEELEQRIERVDQAPTGVAVPDELRGGKRDFGARLDAMYALIELALRTDSTRTVTLMLGNAGSNRSYPELGVAEGHHTLSHHGGDPEKHGQVAKINRFHVERFAGLLERLSRAADGTGSLLDSSLIVYGSGLADGNRHAHHDLPILLAGRGGGAVRPGAHVAYETGTPLANLYLTILHAAGVRHDAFGDSTGLLPLPGRGE